jgi:N-acetylglucosaminyldiphosphoundecaprenol N-acetyl-beta-D-mannosaminyltransferase
MAIERRMLCGLPFDDVSLETALAIVATARPTDRFAYVVTPNVDHVVRAARAGREVVHFYDRALLSLLDSRVLHRLALGHPARPQAVVPGSTLTAALFSRVIATDDPITVIGCDAGTVTALRKRYGLTRLRHHEPPMGFADDPAAFDACLTFVEAASARFVFLAVGSPRQERLAHALVRRGRASGIGLCIGASLAFAAGTMDRAPRWMQGAGLEWLHRLASEPRRLWRRYLIDGPAILAILRSDRRAIRRASAGR